MYQTIEEYLDALKKEMPGCDAALVQDALSDAREHLTLALQAARENNPDIDDADALAAIVEEYGTPEETAGAYREIERRTSPSLKPVKKPASFWGRIFGVYIDPRTWGSLLFMLITFLTGIIYFTWAVTGLALSLSLSILIIGVPFAILFLLSVRGISLLEGRLVEALLGERMPRRPLFAQPGLKWQERLKALVTDKLTWLSILYMLLQMPLGILYFSLGVILITLALSFMAAPFAQVIWHYPLISLDDARILLPYWGLVVMELGGFVLLTATLHLSRAIGWLHGRYAKWMLVG
jgi:hypothetical protein